MGLHLPPPSDEQLEHSPLALVVFQLNFTGGQPPGGLAAAHVSNRLSTVHGFDFAKSEPVHAITVNIAPVSGVTESAGSITGWRLQSADGTWSVTLANGAVTLEAKRYRSWEDDFRARIEGVLESINHFLRPEAEIRLGLRFVDMLTRPEVRNPVEWRGVVSDWLLGPILHDGIGPAVSTVQQQIALEISPGVHAAVRHAAYPDTSRDLAYTYVLDCDVYRDVLRPFDVSTALSAADSFHTVALSIFQAMITPAFYQSLRGAARTPA